MRGFLLAFTILSSCLFADDAADWVKNSALSPSSEGMEWSREQFRNFLELRAADQQEKIMSTQKDLVVCLSTSVPRSLWMQIGQSSARPSRIVLRGIPSEGLLHLQAFLHSLKRDGFNATVQVDPRVFREHGVQSVPCYISGDLTVYGAITPECALERLEGARK